MTRFVRIHAIALLLGHGRVLYKEPKAGVFHSSAARSIRPVRQAHNPSDQTGAPSVAPKSNALIVGEVSPSISAKASMPFLSGIHLAVLLLLFTIAVGMYADFKSEQMHWQHLQIQTGLERMVRLNQSLTGELATAVIEKNMLRAASYDALNAQLEHTMQEVQSQTQYMALTGEILALHDEQRALRGQESQVFTFMREEKWDAAYKLVLSGDYVMALKVYEINSASAVGALIQELSTRTQRQDHLRQITLVLRMVAVLLLLWAGWRYSKRLQAELAEQMNLRSQVSAANEALEEKVRLRTTELQAANSQLEILSTTDSLTGLANRRRFERYWIEEWQRALRQATPLAVIMLDVDHFKAYNDHYGHHQGDECLRRIGAVLQTTVRRAGELAARYGGEEFVVVLPGVTRQRAQETAQGILSDIREAHMPHASSPVANVVTVSLGVSVGIPAATDEREFMLKKADSALYAAKNSGRNRMVLAT
jgi:diguanylate cyclase (GGDEF)-like protein